MRGATPIRHPDCPIGSLGGLKIDVGLAAQRCIDNNPLEIIVGLGPNAHCGLANSHRF
jgi:hypothetical protein